MKNKNALAILEILLLGGTLSIPAPEGFTCWVELSKNNKLVKTTANKETDERVQEMLDWSLEEFLNTCEGKDKSQMFDLVWQLMTKRYITEKEDRMTERDNRLNLALLEFGLGTVGQKE